MRNTRTSSMTTIVAQMISSGRNSGRLIWSVSFDQVVDERLQGHSVYSILALFTTEDTEDTEMIR